MADSTKNPNDDQNRLTPRSVEPEHRDSVGGAAGDRSTGDDHRRTLREDPVRKDSVAGDQAGVAGGSIDSNVSGLGGNKP